MSRFYTSIILMSFFAVLYAILHAISEKKRDFRNCYGVFKRDKEIEYELYSIFYWLHDSRHVGYLRTPIDRQTFESEIDEYLDKVKECTAFRDKVFGKIGTRFARCAYKHDNWFGCLLNITILWSHICYNTLNVLFLLCSLSAISLHLKHVHLLNYKIPCSGVISRPAASTSCRSFFITSAGIHLRSTLTVRTRLRLRTMSIGA